MFRPRIWLMGHHGPQFRAKADLPVGFPYRFNSSLFLFSENYLSTIFYSDIIETVIYSDYICCKCSPYSTRFQWQYNPRHDCVAFKIHLQADNHSFLEPTPPPPSPVAILHLVYNNKVQYFPPQKSEHLSVLVV